jgi:hypothetical protein
MGSKSVVLTLWWKAKRGTRGLFFQQNWFMEEDRALLWWRDWTDVE